MKIIIGIDQCIILLVERIAHWLQDWTGKNNFWFARIIIFAFIASVIIRSQLMLKEKGLAILSPMSLVTGVLVSFLFLVYSYLSEQLTLRSYKSRNNNSRPDFGPAVVRLILIIWLLIDVPFILSDGDMSGLEIYSVIRDVTYLIIWYLLCVTPKPPSDSKIKKLLKSLFQKREVVSVPS